MPSKKSKSVAKQAQLAWKAERVYSEAELPSLAKELASVLRAGDRVLLEGPLGAGKTTFAKWVLQAIGIESLPEGSPTFAIAHEYSLPEHSKQGTRAVHVDLYRITSEAEIEERGLLEFFWDPEKIVLCEWTSLWPEFESALKRSASPTVRNWLVQIQPETLETRLIKIMQLEIET